MLEPIPETDAAWWLCCERTRTRDLGERDRARKIRRGGAKPGATAATDAPLAIGAKEPSETATIDVGMGTSGARGLRM